MIIKRQILPTDLESKALNLGKLLKDRNISLDGINGDSILSSITSIENDQAEIQRKEHELRDFKEKLKSKREQLYNDFRVTSDYINSRSRNEPELKGMLSSFKVSKKKRKKVDSETQVAA
ncbi:MAG TPA: hypothetical protein PK079_20390 [Leptospiraceae bacterium]|nr:hypothetical protein [Leptospiraceae bacterium]HMX35406.1 hypothetical protein [Leptospiraceae bacterium]HMY32217.1 hypothetical protein [Leptospiraceae bacterium]HMZ67430.1 hypothetical protein [Leptospiraceae bacterium]HNC56255.1 hypothetical protein [Leptospiraceae bacterium]